MCVLIIIIEWMSYISKYIIFEKKKEKKKVTITFFFWIMLTGVFRIMVNNPF